MSEEGKGSRGSLLLVEDNGDDILFFKRVLDKLRPEATLEVVRHGAAAVERLSEPGRAPPSLMVLDLKLPRMSGLEVLEWMRTQPALRSVRTVVLTSSSEESDVRRACALGAASYVAKPLDVAGLLGVVAAIVDYWERPEGPAAAGLPRPASGPVVDNDRYR